MNKVFLTFGNRKFYGALNRILKQVENTNFFDKIYQFNELNLSRLPNYKQIFPIIQKFKKGYGLWIWKIFIINYVLEQIQFNDILVYCDAGCYFEEKYINELDKLIEKLKNEEYDNIALQLPFIEQEWTKMDTIIACNANNIPEIIETGQLIGGIQIIKKSPDIVELFKNAYKIALNIHLLDDSPSVTPNVPKFRAHRHDQSILSLLRKKHTKTLIIPDYSYSDDWTNCHFPIQARRLRN